MNEVPDLDALDTQVMPEAEASASAAVASSASPAAVPTTPAPATPAAPTIPTGVSAADWLQSVGLPLTEEKLESMGFEDCQELLLALLDSPDAVEAARFAIYGNGAPATATISWLRDLSDAVIAAYLHSKADTFSRRLYLTLETIYGKSIYRYGSGRTETKRFNPLHFAAHFAFSHHIRYDDQIGCFFSYNPKTGKWSDVSDVEVREALTRFAVPFIERMPGLYSGSDQFFKDILSHMRSLVRSRPQRPADWRFLLVANGTLAFNVGSGKIEACGHSPAYRLRNRIPV